MKKNTLIYLIIGFILIVLIASLMLSQNKNEIKDQSIINKIITDSNLELLINLGNFSNNNYSEEKILEVAMLYAENNGYLNETDETFYIQYINYLELHTLIKELTNITIEAPIQIEDFYYRYDSENEYYYSIGLEVPKYQISNINKVYKTDDNYIIEYTVTKTLDGEITEQKNVITELKQIKNSTYTNYQIIKQSLN